MNIKEFNNVIDDQLERCKYVLTRKGNEYAPFEDRLEHFKKSAVLMHTNPKKALFAFMTKHLISISDMCETETTLEEWNEKITDSINYLLILKAIIMEECNEKYTDKNTESRSNS